MFEEKIVFCENKECRQSYGRTKMIVLSKKELEFFCPQCGEKIAIIFDRNNNPARICKRPGKVPRCYSNGGKIYTPVSLKIC